jgi:hypothetical protein
MPGIIDDAPFEYIWHTCRFRTEFGWLLGSARAIISHFPVSIEERSAMEWFLPAMIF